MGPVSLFLATAPHILFELLALWLSAAAAYTVPRDFIRYINKTRGRNRNPVITLIDLLSLTVVASVLMAIGAIIEVLLSARLA